MKSRENPHKQTKKKLSTCKKPLTTVFSTALESEHVKKCPHSSYSQDYDMSTTKKKLPNSVIFVAPNGFFSPLLKKCQQLQFACHKCETTQMTENEYHYIMTNHTCGSVLSHAHNVFQKNRFSEQSNFVKIYVHNENIIVARENIVLLSRISRIHNPNTDGEWRRQ
jgi:hypothetical protein